jgi:hypothetical protein
MPTTHLQKNLDRAYTLVCCILLLFISGCTQFQQMLPQEGTATDSTSQAMRNEPYYPTDFKDLLIPGELDWNRDKSMTIKTDAFSGGILSFSGRVEVRSLTNFFITSMVNNRWKMTGSVESQRVLLSFVKQRQTCMIRIVEGDFGLKTDIIVYITKDLTGR